MGNLPRWIRGDRVTSATQRTVDRQFLFKPDPVVRNIIGASAARAQHKFPVKIYWLEFNINHEQAGLAPMDDSQQSMTDLIRFKQLFHRLIAQEINRHLTREGGLFSSRSRDVHCVDNESVENRFLYALTNPVKDGLCDRIKHWGGFSSYSALAEGKREKFTYIDRSEWHRAGGRKSSIPLKVYEKEIELVFTPLPGWERLSEPQRQTRIRKEVRSYEQKFREEREAQNRFAMTREKMDKVNPRDRPNTPAENTPKPLCHAASKEAKDNYLTELITFLKSYYQASSSYLSGFFDVQFPKGSFRPPLIAAAA